MPSPRLLHRRAPKPASLAALSDALRPAGAATSATTWQNCSARSRGKTVCAGGGGARALTCQTAHSQSTRPTSPATRALGAVMSMPPGGRASSGTEAAVSRARPTNSHAGASWELPSKIVEAQPNALHDHLQTLGGSAHCVAVGRCRCDARPCECLPLRATDARLPRCTPCTARRPFASFDVARCRCTPARGLSVTPGPRRAAGVKKEPFGRALCKHL